MLDTSGCYGNMEGNTGLTAAAHPVEGGFVAEVRRVILTLLFPTSETRDASLRPPGTKTHRMSPESF